MQQFYERDATSKLVPPPATPHPTNSILRLSIPEEHGANMSFDFTSYLSIIDPKQSYNVHLLTGGVVNTTARASRGACQDAAQSRFPDSFILKHALPYVAGIGPEAPFSTFRQVGSYGWFLNTLADSVWRLSRHERCHSSSLPPTVYHIFAKSQG